VTKGKLQGSFGSGYEGGLAGEELQAGDIPQVA
jgi:hypothetical protein